MGFPGGTVVKNPPANVGDARDTAIFKTTETQKSGVDVGEERMGNKQNTPG